MVEKPEANVQIGQGGIERNIARLELDGVRVVQERALIVAEIERLDRIPTQI